MRRKDDIISAKAAEIIFDEIHLATEGLAVQRTMCCRVGWLLPIARFWQREIFQVIVETGNVALFALENHHKMQE